MNPSGLTTGTGCSGRPSFGSLRGELATDDGGGAGEDWPAVASASEEAWREAQARLAETYAALRAAVLGLDEALLDEPILPEMSTRYVSLHGAVQHTLYHAGQIALVKRALGLNLPPVVPQNQPA